MKSKTKRVLTMALAVILALALLAGAVLPALADDLGDLEEEKEELEEEAAEQEALANATEEEIAQAQEKLDAAMKEIDAINGRMDTVGERLISLNQQISENQALLEKTEGELQTAQEDMHVYYQALKGRIQMMYENDRVTYLEILLDAGSIADFFSRYEYISEMVEYDNNIMEHLNDCKVTIETAKATIEETQAELESDQAEQLQKQTELQALLDDKQAQYDTLKEDELALELLRQRQEEERAAIEARIAEIQGQIDNIHYQQQLAAQQAAAAARRTSQTQQVQQQPQEQPEETPQQQEEVPAENTEGTSEEDTADNTGEASEETQEETPAETQETETGSETAEGETTEEEYSEETPSESESQEETQEQESEQSETQESETSYEVPDDGQSESTYYDSTGRYMPDIDCWSTWPGIGSGELTWPVGSYLATSLYGWRIHPIYGDERFHSGLDLGAGYGSPIYACDSGTVIIAEYYGGYGNLIVIDHGNGMTTWYGHQSGFAVGVGDYVERGQVIGYVGSTGDSTGPHLHLEVHVGGTSMDPEWYL